MTPRPKKTKLTVQFKPLEQEGVFDIKAPKNQVVGIKYIVF